MKVLVACDKFKGSMTAPQACRAIAEGLREGSRGTVEVRMSPVADGGEGMSRALIEAKGGEWLRREVRGPDGLPVEAGYGIFDGGETAAIEMAEASGLWRVRGKNDPWTASTHGTGELIADAVNRGVRRIFLGIGGSATNDGGTGMAEALGVEFLGDPGERVIRMPENLMRVTGNPHLRPPGWAVEVTVACDVRNPLLGPRGATRVYGPQKGVTEAEMPRHEERLAHLVALTGAEAAAEVPGAGAAGGLGFGAIVFLGGNLVPGFDLVAESVGLEEKVAWADLVITGEGRIDGQSLEGKAPAGVARLAKRLGKRTAVFCGLRGEGELGDLFDEVWEIDRKGATVEESIAAGDRLLRETARAVFSGPARADSP